MLSVGLYVATSLLAICITLWIYRGKKKQSGSDELLLPPGSKGFPLIGETFQLIIPSYSLDLPSFIKTRVKRYGPVFQTRLVGRSVVISTDQDFNRHIVQQEGKIVEIWYLDTFSKLFAHDGEARTNAAGHIPKYIRNITLSHFGSESLREKLSPQIEDLVRRSTLRSWSNKGPIEVKKSALAVIIDFAAVQLFGCDSDKTKVDIAEKLTNMMEGLLSFPLNIPGTAYHRCLKNKKEIMDILKDSMKEKLASMETYRDDLLYHALKDLEKDELLTEDFILNTTFALLLASSESTSTTLRLVLKFLGENTQVLQELTEEHEKIVANRVDANSVLYWNEVKSMTSTFQVINESLRLGNASLGLLRRALKDIHVNGYTVPAGWTIMVVASACHYDPAIYADPLTFNPWRWKDLEPDVISKNFMPFGGGIRQCAGAEFSKVLMAIFLHVLVTNYRWIQVKGGEIVRSPLLKFPNGLYIKVVEKQI